MTFEWNAVQITGGPESVVDDYVIYIFNSSSFLVSVASTNSSSLSIILEYNIEYEANLTAINCVGESPAITLPSFEYSKHNNVIAIIQD